MFCPFAIKRNIMRNCLEILSKQCWQLLLWPLKGTRGRVFLITRFSIPGQYNTKVHCTEIILIWPNEIFLSDLPFKKEHLLGQKFKYASLTRLVPSICYFFRLFIIFYLFNWFILWTETKSIFSHLDQKSVVINFFLTKYVEKALI